MDINLYNGDCMEAMKAMPDKAYDLAIVDPPYGNSIMCKNKYQRHRTKDTTYRNKTAPDKQYFAELFRVSERQIVWGCQYMLHHLPPGGSFIIWDKGADPDLHNMSACDVAWHSKLERIRKKYLHWCGAVKCENEPTIHIHQKPVALYKWLLKNYAKPGDKILDTHGGSMSIAIACHDMGFYLDLWELDADYYTAGVARFEQHKKQGTLFKPSEIIRDKAPQLL